MGQVFYHLVIILAGVFAIITGYKAGFVKQIGSVVAMAFAIAAAYFVSPHIREYVGNILPDWAAFNVRFVIDTLSAMIVFFAVYYLIRLLMVPLRMVMGFISGGMINALLGSVYRLFKYMLFISLFLNLIADIDPKSSIVKSSRNHDGNVVEGVVKIAPILIGFPGVEELGHYQQLEEAKKIS